MAENTALYSTNMSINTYHYLKIVWFLPHKQLFNFTVSDLFSVSLAVSLDKQTW